MKTKELFELARPYLEKNDFGIGHTKRVFDIAGENFDIPPELEEVVFASIILHDVGGSSIKDQYEKGPKIAASLLQQIGHDKETIKTVCGIIRTHHEHPENPSLAFKILYDSDRLVMFSPEEFSHYNSRLNFNWKGVIDSIYSDHARKLAEEIYKKVRK